MKKDEGAAGFSESEVFRITDHVLQGLVYMHA